MENGVWKIVLRRYNPRVKKNLKTTDRRRCKQNLT